MTAHLAGLDVAPQDPVAAAPPPDSTEPVAVQRSRLAGPLEKLQREWVRWLTAAVPFVAASVGLIAFSSVDAADARPFGLVTIYPLAAWLCLAALTLSFVTRLWRYPRTNAVLALHTVSLILLLTAVAPLSEGVARMPTAWLHAGFVDHISATGQVIAHTDARWSWPGFFAGVAALLKPAGLSDARPLMLWAPLVAQLAYLLPVLQIARVLLVPVRAKWFGVWLFYLANWSGQDYFSPQAVAELLFLSALAIVLTLLMNPPRRVRARVDSWGRPQPQRLHIGTTPPEGPLVTPSSQQRTAAMIVVLLVMIGLIPTHQLTPVALVTCLAALVVVRSTAAPALWVAGAVILVTYVNYATYDFWSGHLKLLLGLSSGHGVDTGVAARIKGDELHQQVVYLRLALTAAVWGLATIGAFRRLRRGRFDAALIALAVAPLPLPLAQSYGGEGVIRAFLYSLPFMAGLAAFAFFPEPGRTWQSHVGVVAVVAVLAPVFLVSRYGNETFERVRPQEIAALDYVYAHAPPGVTLVGVGSGLPWQYTKLGDYHYRFVYDVPSAAGVDRVMDRAKHPAYLIVTASEEETLFSQYGIQRGWRERITRELSTRPYVKVVFQSRDATVMRFVAPESVASTGGSR